MNRKKFITITIAIAVAVFIFILFLFQMILSQNNSAPSDDFSDHTGQIYLYGEWHGNQDILDYELEQWRSHYDQEGMRHLFIEYPYYTAEFMNIWMKSDNDEILDAIYSDWDGTAAHVPAVKEFYQQIKTYCPKTIFHGTDVGHQSQTTGKRFLSYLEQNGQKDSVQYVRTQEVMAQGDLYYNRQDEVYRENTMVQNFIYELNSLDGESIMGIYGAAHTDPEKLDYTNSVPCMANQLKQSYGDLIHSVDMSRMALLGIPFRIDTITLGGKSYQASYFGRVDISQFENYSYRKFWRIEDAYDDCKDLPVSGAVLPYHNYPMPLETGQVFVIEYTMKDGSMRREYYRSDGNEWNDLPCTEEFLVP